jgi:protein associated with RNAse G/E
MQRDFRVESRSYDHLLRGSWQAYKLNSGLLGNEEAASDLLEDCTRLWLPANTPMHWSSGTRTLRSNCLQFYWPGRWYMLSAFYNEDILIHTYVNIIKPAQIQLDRISYTELDLSVLVKPDRSYEVLTQAEFDYNAETLHYDEETRVSALVSLQTLTSSIQYHVGFFSVVPYRLNLAKLHAERL